MFQQLAWLPALATADTESWLAWVCLPAALKALDKDGAALEDLAPLSLIQFAAKPAHPLWLTGWQEIGEDGKFLYSATMIKQGRKKETRRHHPKVTFILM